MYHSSLQAEQAELDEFELLEQAADDCSFSSQSSLVSQQLPKSSSAPHHNPPSQSSQPRQSVLARFAKLERLDVRELASAAGFGFGLKEIREDVESPDDKDGTTFATAHVEASPSPRAGSPVSDDGVLDRTLTPLSPSHDFNDEEAWESFNQGSPFCSHQNREFKDSCSSGSVTPDMPNIASSTPWISPVKREQLDSNGEAVFTSPLPAPSLVRTLEPTLKQSSAIQNLFSPLEHTVFLPQNNPPGGLKPANLQQLPPPSALVSKLFPALRRDRPPETRPEPSQQASRPESSQQASGPSPLVNTPSPVQSSFSDSGKGSLSSASALMNDELKQKLCQLEMEIERFRSENTVMEKLRRSKEEVSI